MGAKAGRRASFCFRFGGTGYAGHIDRANLAGIKDCFALPKSAVLAILAHALVAADTAKAAGKDVAGRRRGA
ncbi:hypothetical protein [Novosphingobium sp. SG720]|uniref:hypothetical protein n=1 Tax=Novosphingobium TaxID=165696 RepID=UPI001444A0B6|nr:hypothetical protein [Novosphingobium sp. SG720]NMN03724.1 hypothetical protein [Novosphingobium sp. SG919]